jgi:hypothetical protein
MCVGEKTNTGNVPTIEKRQRLALNGKVFTLSGGLGFRPPGVSAR